MSLSSGTDFGRNPFEKGFLQAIFLKLLKVLGNREPLWRGFKGKTLFQKGFPLKLMTLPLWGEGTAGSSCGRVRGHEEGWFHEEDGVGFTRLG
jgi:hypothetical protein